jgi:mannose-6-phosphate isomerase-like protein (cupin superfamily)
VDRPGGREGSPLYIAPLHIHHADDEAWYVLEGTLCVPLGDRDVEIPPGGGILVPRGTPHTYWNARPEPARYLLIMTPRIRALIDAIHAPDARDERTLATLFAEHETEYLGWP